MLTLPGLSYEIPGKTDQCPACRSRKILFLEPSLERKYQSETKKYCFISGCRVCGLLFINPPKPPEYYEEYYSTDGGWSEDKAWRLDEKKDRAGKIEFLRTRSGGPEREALIERLSKLKDYVAHPDIRRHVDVFNPTPGKNKVLDFGCGVGHLLDTFKGFGWQTYGLDPSTRDRIRYHEVLEALPDHEVFDLAISHHVFEHVQDPLDQLKAIHKSLKPSGHLIIAIPFIDHIGENGELSYCLNYHVHGIAYSSRALISLLAMAGFETLYWFTRSHTARICCLAIKRDGPVQAEPNPLTAARAALRAYHRNFGWDESLWTRALPITIRTELLNRNFYETRENRRKERNTAKRIEFSRRKAKKRQDMLEARRVHRRERNSARREKNGVRRQRRITRARARWSLRLGRLIGMIKPIE